MYRINIFSLLLFACIMSIATTAQTNPIIKIELQGGVGLNSGNFTPCLPAIYVPVHRNIDLGFQYNIIEITYKGSYTTVSGGVVYRFPSFYFKINFSENMSRVNPFMGYIFSVVKGKHSSRPQEGDAVGYNPYEQMTESEEMILEKELAKSQAAHGAQAGCELKISRSVSCFLKATVFSFGKNAFHFHYKDNQFSYNNQVYAFGGFVFKIYAKTNKSLIK